MKDARKDYKPQNIILYNNSYKEQLMIIKMKLYRMPKELDFENLRCCLDNYAAKEVFVQTICTKGSETLVDENLKGRKLDFRKDYSGLYLFIDSKETLHFPLKQYDMGFSMIYDPKPNSQKSMLRNFIDWKMFWIVFNEKIPLKFHSWRDEEMDLKYWTVDKKVQV